MKKKFLTLLALLVLLPVMAFATDVVITWEWMLDDPQITGFRYQLDGEDPDNWTVVDGITSSCSIQHLDGSKEYTLYLQQTYDGVNWSPSALSVAMPLFSADDVVAEEAVAEEVVAEEVAEEVVATEEAETVEEVKETEATDEETSASVEETETPVVAVEKDPSDYYTSLSLRGTAGYSLNTVTGSGATYDQYSIAAGLGLGLNNIVSIGNVGLGLNIDTDFVVMPINGNAMAALKSFFTNTALSDYSLRLTVAPELQFNFNKLTIDIAPLVDATLVDYPYIGSVELAPDYFDHFAIGYGAQLGLQFNATEKLQLGLIGKVRNVNGFSTWKDVNSYGIEVTPTISFKF